MDGEVTYVPGPDPRERVAPALDGFALRTVLRDRDGGVLHEQALPEGQIRWLGTMPGDVPFADLASVEIAGTFTPSASGTHRFAIRGVGPFRLEVAGSVRYDETLVPEGTDPAAAFLNPPQLPFPVDLQADETVRVSLTYTVPPPKGALASFGLVSFELGHREPSRPVDEQIAAAVASATSADVALVFVGTTDESESEGVDRGTLALPGAQDDLVARVAAANPRTVVVVNAGAPVLMPWRNDVSALLLAWFPGQEGGAALADVLTGAAEPGGRLPTTWPATDTDSPVWQVEQSEGALPYTEGTRIGYRAWQHTDAAPAYWFGAGRGYTTWAYETIAVTPVPNTDAPFEPVAEVRVTVRNTGSREGRETVQVYLSDDGPTLAGFAVVSAAPGETAEARIEIPLRAVQEWNPTSRTWTTLTRPLAVTAASTIDTPHLTATLKP